MQSGQKKRAPMEDGHDGDSSASSSESSLEDSEEGVVADS